MDIVVLSDYVFLAGSTVKMCVLYPTLKDPTAYVPWSTSIPTMCCWLAFATCYYLLTMGLAAIATYAGAVMWFMVVLRKGDSLSDITEFRKEITNHD